jgi:hypothetical protein
VSSGGGFIFAGGGVGLAGGGCLDPVMVRGRDVLGFSIFASAYG